LAKRGSVFERSHMENELPRVFAMTFWWRQESHRPAGGAPGRGARGLIPTSIDRQRGELAAAFFGQRYKAPSPRHN
jgi:hypothetical protein